jgi:hypothetical protein
MVGKRAVLVGLVAIGLLVSAVAVANADAPSGFTSVLIGRGQSAHSFGIQQRKDNDVVTTQITIQPAGYSGWHSHPGITVLVLQSGQTMLFSEPIAGGECSVHTFTAGQVFLEHPDTKYNNVNTGAVPAVLAVSFFNVPHGGSPRIEQTNPGNC